MTYVTNDMPLATVLENDPGVANILFDYGMHCLGCIMAKGETLAQAAQVHGVDPEQLSTKINTYLAGKSGASA